ncbi:hypothetical protein NDU88_002691 [Pleurodeles waltl]|uniref:Uncharacterized protein n=1 Tax=Pleurodeles waltl TaxID=8319 RepID=A0AAV7P7Q5_PLEWA|nr:hypothetical protein NDU88_002691 [Pleurodeles waltl]
MGRYLPPQPLQPQELHSSSERRAALLRSAIRHPGPPLLRPPRVPESDPRGPGSTQTVPTPRAGARWRLVCKRIRARAQRFAQKYAAVTIASQYVEFQAV